MAKRVDSHHHVWQLDRGDYDWLTTAGYPTLQRDFGADDLAPLLAEFAIDGSVLVQAAETIAETRHMLAVAEQTDFIEAVVGWIDITRADAPDTLAALAENPLFRGIRPMIVFQDDTAWLRSSNEQRALEALSRLGLVFDALVAAEQLDGLRDIMVANPIATVSIRNKILLARRVVVKSRWNGNGASPFGDLFRSGWNFSANL